MATTGVGYLPAWRPEKMLRMKRDQRPDAPQFFHRSNDDGTFSSICLSCFRTVATQNHEVDLAGKEQAHVCYRYGEKRTAKLISAPPGHKVYQLDICDAINDHIRCPGFGLLSVGSLELGPAACTCECHKKPTTERSTPLRGYPLPDDPNGKCSTYQELERSYDLAKSKWQQYAYPEKHRLPGISNALTKRIVSEQQRQMNELSRQMQDHRQRCPYCLSGDDRT